MIKKWKYSFPLWDDYFSKKEQIILFLLVLVGMILRVVNAVYTPFWKDEIYIFYVARTNTLWQLITQQHWDTAHPPLHSLFLHVWQMFSPNPVWLRIPSIITSFFILYLIPILAIKIEKKYRLLPFVFLFVFSISHTQISLNMVSRPYPFVILLSILSLINILDLYNKKTLSFKKTYIFLLVNALGFYIDYSFIWLFFTYLFVLTIQFFRNKDKRKIIIVLVQSLIGTAIVLIPAFIMLFINLPQSLKLEAQSGTKFQAPPHTNTLQGGLITISLHKKEGPRLVVSNTKPLIDKDAQWITPLFDGTQHLGFDIPPLSGIIVNKLAYCSSKTPQCVTYHDFQSQLGKSKLKSIVTQEIGSSILLFNLHPKEWRSYQFPVPKVQGATSLSVQTSFMIIGYYPSPQILFTSTTEGSVDYLDPSKVHAAIKIENRNLHYEARFRNFQNDLKVQFIESSTLLDTFRTDLLFFSSLPSHDHDIYVWLSFVFLLLSTATLIKLFRGDKKLNPILSLSLFFIPIFASFCISILISPIFVSRNLYISSFAYLLGISFLTTSLLMRTGFRRNLGIGLLFVFTYILFAKYPFLHYVDPPYAVNMMTRIILDNHKVKKKIVIIDNASYYEPLLYYHLLLAKHKDNDIAVVTLESFREILSTLHINTEQKKNYEYYFIRFNQNSNNFREVADFLECKLDPVEIKYVFFANCRH